ncbi:hypothetical protein FB451DRAFT_1228643 [Mycena latifolia]|nr:hypothetical protein FB451DRAFT_1228643 [Mycena latifolia]
MAEIEDSSDAYATFSSIPTNADIESVSDPYAEGSHPNRERPSAGEPAGTLNMPCLSFWALTLFWESDGRVAVLGGRIQPRGEKLSTKRDQFLKKGATAFGELNRSQHVLCFGERNKHKIEIKSVQPCQWRCGPFVCKYGKFPTRTYGDITGWQISTGAAKLALVTDQKTLVLYLSRAQLDGTLTSVESPQAPVSHKHKGKVFWLLVASIFFHSDGWAAKGVEEGG